MTHPPSIGREAIRRTTERSFLDSQRENGPVDVSIEIKEITPTAPDWAFARTESKARRVAQSTQKDDDDEKEDEEEEEAEDDDDDSQEKGKGKEPEPRGEKMEEDSPSTSSASASSSSSDSDSKTQQKKKKKKKQLAQETTSTTTTSSNQDLFILQRIKLADQRADGQGELWEWRIARYCFNATPQPPVS